MSNRTLVLLLLMGLLFLWRLGLSVCDAVDESRARVGRSRGALGFYPRDRNGELRGHDAPLWSDVGDTCWYNPPAPSV